MNGRLRMNPAITAAAATAISRNPPGLGLPINAPSPTARAPAVSARAAVAAALGWGLSRWASSTGNPPTASRTMALADYRLRPDFAESFNGGTVNPHARAALRSDKA